MISTTPPKKFKDKIGHYLLWSILGIIYYCIVVPYSLERDIYKNNKK